MEITNFTTMLLAAISPVVVALIRKWTWPDEVVTLLAMLVVAVIYTLGRWLDGALAWPLGSDYAIGLFAAFGVQQLVFGMTKRTAPMQTLATFGDDPVPPRALLDRPRMSVEDEALIKEQVDRALNRVATAQRVSSGKPPVPPV